MDLLVKMFKLPISIWASALHCYCNMSDKVEFMC